MRTSRKCGRCGSRETSPGRKVEGYGSVCPRCFELCAFPVEEVAQGLAALATGAIRLPLGFTSYRALRERRAAEAELERAKAELQAEQEEGARLERQRAAIDRLRGQLGRMSRAKRGALLRRMAELMGRA